MSQSLRRASAEAENRKPAGANPLGVLPLTVTTPELT
jgi:hypothetical protein